MPFRNLFTSRYAGEFQKLRMASTVSGVSLHVADSGTGPTVLFVHGFPDTWRGWRRQMEAVVSAGHQAVAFDMRGFGQSSKPDDVASYTALQCVGDLVGILDALEIERAVLVGHDFGAAVSWTAAMMRPDRFSAVFCLSVPPLVPTRPRMLEQLRASGQDQFYMFRQMRAEVLLVVRSGSRRPALGPNGPYSGAHPAVAGRLARLRRLRGRGGGDR